MSEPDTVGQYGINVAVQLTAGSQLCDVKLALRFCLRRFPFFFVSFVGPPPPFAESFLRLPYSLLYQGNQGYFANSKHWFRTSFLQDEACLKVRLGVWATSVRTNYLTVAAMKGQCPVLTSLRVPGEIKRSRDLRGGRWSWTLNYAQKRS